MDKLKQVIESTLINNLEYNEKYESIDLDSIQTSTDYIAQEIKDIAMEFAIFTQFKKQVSLELFNQFINNRHKES